MTTIKDYVQSFRPPKRQKATVRYETPPGEQAQVDWGICKYKDDNGRLRKLPVFVMIIWINFSSSLTCSAARARYI
ncbi:hypothetical protein [Alicyclobacillus dauci]|uniref:Transposase n=1 Tax=Alicyclobacillus dauci TaxID=1475485 RepID=A0ABY6Z3N7_9BACL|nr:hypothetical protein [Alicyclobacillus dauci]WAH37504.1 hypothetical protein NZD86_02915 [Alicyclobacillus dauci]